VIAHLRDPGDSPSRSELILKRRAGGRVSPPGHPRRTPRSQP
jgi:hypothetical protein